MQVKTCEVCGKRAARYICQECGREVCQFCFEPTTWICSDCYNSLKRETSALESFQWSTPFKLFLLGFVLMFVGIIVMMLATVLFGAYMGAGAIIWVFPLPPIGFGTGPYAFWVILMGVALTVLGLILFIMLRKRAR
ncbi:hypothetical protein IBX38_08420 [Candidatus Bathyarchaeota archaeon]|nr:hypothetical protein [Candidatus Bathyarchaeota archaeon]